jgi:Yip1-like protein
MTIADRAKNIVLAPRTEWTAIEAEPTSINDIYKGYVVPLALIPAIAGFIGASIVGASIPGLGTVRIGFFAGLISAILQFGLSLVLVYVLALIIDALAPTFWGQKDTLAAFKVAAYSMTPTWLAGIFAVIPSISFLSLLGLYGIYVLYLGLPRLMRAPEDKALGYTAVVVLSAIVLSIVLAAVLGLFMGRSIDL